MTHTNLVILSFFTRDYNARDESYAAPLTGGNNQLSSLGTAKQSQNLVLRGTIAPKEAEMGNVHPGVPKPLAIALRDRFDIRCFVETGTYQGGTTAWAAEKFDQVITIEASENLHKETRSKLKHLKNTTFYQGSSVVFLKQIIDQLPQSLFWLDAHWSGGRTAGETDECPLLQELSIISPSLQKHILLIDDARFFVQPPPAEHNSLHWPSLNDIFKVIQSTNQTFTCIVDDCIIIASAAHRSVITACLTETRSAPP